MPKKKRIYLAIALCACAAIGVAASGSEESGQVVALADDGVPDKSLSTSAKKSAKPAPRTPHGQNAADYVLTFAEEFDAFNGKLWNDHIWYEKPNPTKNFTVENGMLKIWPQRDSSGKFFNRTLDTDGRFEQRYGYFEMEAKLPRGKGTWPAFWLLGHPGNRRPEIDIMEAYTGGIEPWGFKDKEGISRPSAYGTTVWLDEGVRADGFQYDAKMDLSLKFHKYAVKWEPHKQTFYFDGKEVFAVSATMPDPKFILLDLWFGSDSGEPDDTTPQGKSNSFEVNYVRAWQFKKRMDH